MPSSTESTGLSLPGIWPEGEQDWRPPFFRGMLLVLLSAVLLSCSALAVGAAAYVYIAGQLPSPEELTIRTDTFESTKIYDRHGALLYEIFHPTAGRRTVVDLDRIPMYLRQATIATEDPTFYDNPGFSPRDILRAFVQNLREGGIVSGASTITQQVVKTAFLSPEVSWTRKIKEAVLATEVTRRYSKDEILEIYLNQSYYGNLAYGIGTAAEVYFRKPVEQLTLAEATMLAGIPQGPAIYDPYTNLAAAKLRQSIVLDLMVRRGYLTRDQAQQVLAEPLAFQPGNIEMIAPHFVVYVREQLEAQYGTDLVYRGGLRVYTSLDLTLQDAAERSIRQRLDELKELEATSASLVAMDPQSGQILAMVGSADFFGEAIDGQVNVALQLRQPGSSIKPITYVAAFEKGWTPATMIMDITSEFPDGANPPYVPHNHDQKEHGPVLVRGALARSLNIPAVKTLQFVTLPSMLEMAHRLGVTSLNRPDYGLALTLGGGDVTLLEMTGAYASFANRGHRVRPVSILRIEDSSGRVIAQASEDAGQRILEPQHAYLITNILSDNEGRLPTFGPGNILELSRPAAVKTGTTDDYRDAWTIGYTPGLVTGVWVGNADGSPMNRVFGSRGAGPIWHDFMEEALRDQPVEEFPVPQGIETAVICPISGKLRSEKCPPGVREMFAEGTAPTATCDVHVDVRICRVSLRRAGEFCPASVVTTQYFEVYPPEYRSWAEANGKPQPPLDLCHVHVQAPRVVIDQPSDGSLVEGIVPVYGSARLDDFHHFEVQYGIGENPIGWGQVLWEDSALVDSLLGAWDTRALPNALYSLRVVVFDRQGNSLVSPGVRVRVLNPTPTPTLTSTPSPTPTWTPTATVSATLSATPTTAATPTYTLQPSEPVPTTTPQPTATSVPEQTPTSTQQPTATYTPEPTPTANPSPSPTQPGSTVTPTILPEPPATPAT